MKTTVNKEDYWVCNRCKINSNTKGRMIPCPRGGCEAKLKGQIIITKELKLFSDEVKKV